MSKVRYLAVRSVQTVFLLFGVLTFLFLLFRLMPGDFTDVLLAAGASPEAVRAAEQKWGLNDPLYVQYIQYVTNFITLDVGTSLQTGQPVWTYVSHRIFNTFILAAPAITVAYILGSVFGSLLGFNRGSNFERGGLIGSLFVGSFPSFFLAMVMIIVFAGWLGVFPTGGLASLSTTTSTEHWWQVYFTVDFLHHYTLPFATIVVRYLYLPSITMRNSVVEVSDQEFMYYHKISGFPVVEQIKRLIRHASLPVITLYPVSMTQAISGIVLIETVFNWPGIGHAIVVAVFNRDFPVLMFVFFITAAMVIIANFVVDVLYTVIDPRITLEEG